MEVPYSKERKSEGDNDKCSVYAKRFLIFIQYMQISLHTPFGQPPECQLRTEKSEVNLNDKSELGKIAQLLPCSFVTLDRANGLLALLLFASQAACYTSVKIH